MQIEGTTALVSGANRGIGKAIARPCSSAAPRRSTPAVRNPATVSAADRRLVAAQLDVTDADRAGRRRRARRRRAGRQQRGHRPPGHPADRAGLDAARAELEANYLALIATTQAFAPVLATNGGGAFVNVLSVASWAASPMLSTYSASKAAAWSFTNSARVELKQQGTHVVGVHVGFVDTDLTAALAGDKIAPAAVAAAALDAVEAGNPRRSSTSSAAGSSRLSDDQRALYPQIERDFAALVGSRS